MACMLVKVSHIFLTKSEAAIVGCMAASQCLKEYGAGVRWNSFSFCWG